MKKTQKKKSTTKNAKATPKKPVAKTVAKVATKAKTAPVAVKAAPVAVKPPVEVESAPIIRESKMGKKKIEEFRKLLNGKKNELIAEAVQSVGELTEVQEVLPDMTDQASAEMERNFMLRIKDRERKLIHKINQVLKKLDDGSYGVCEICGDQINEARLKARPETTQCIECKTDMEEQERRASM